MRPIGEGAEVRCEGCKKLLFTVGRSPDGGLVVERACRGRFENVLCGLLNRGRLTDRRGKPVDDSLPETWKCGRCGRHLARIHPVKGRITLRCRCNARIVVIAADALRPAKPLNCAS